MPPTFMRLVEPQALEARATPGNVKSSRAPVGGARHARLTVAVQRQVKPLLVAPVELGYALAGGELHPRVGLLLADRLDRDDEGLRGPLRRRHLDDAHC